MKKIIAHCGIGYCGAEHEEEFEFDDNYTDEEIEEEIYDWATQFLDVWWDVEEESEN